MPAKILEGGNLRGKIIDEVKAGLKKLSFLSGKIKLIAVQVGSHPSSEIYLNRQREAVSDLGLLYEVKALPESIDESGLSDVISGLNLDKTVTGIIIQMPLPGNLPAGKIQSMISPSKDVEGITPVNLGSMVLGRPVIVPPTAAAAAELLKYTGIDLKGKEVVIVSHSEIVGKPLSLLLLASLDSSPTVTVCHIATSDLSYHTRKADVLFTAAGKPMLITEDMVKPEAVVIDIGINRIFSSEGKTKIAGDVDFDKVKDKVSWITPVPGGVGPLTVSMLMKNLLECARLQNSAIL